MEEGAGLHAEDVINVESSLGIAYHKRRGALKLDA